MSSLQEAGITTWNPSTPFLSLFQPTNGTAGNYNVNYLPTPWIPFKSRIQYELQLLNTSTQSSATVELIIFYVNVFNSSLFFSSFANLQGLLQPPPMPKGLPLRQRGAQPLSGQKPNPFLQVTEEEQYR